MSFQTIFISPPTPSVRPPPPQTAARLRLCVCGQAGWGRGVGWRRRGRRSENALRAACVSPPPPPPPNHRCRQHSTTTHTLSFVPPFRHQHLNFQLLSTAPCTPPPNPPAPPTHHQCHRHHHKFGRFQGRARVPPPSCGLGVKCVVGASACASGTQGGVCSHFHHSQQQHRRVGTPPAPARGPRAACPRVWAGGGEARLCVPAADTAPPVCLGVARPPRPRCPSPGPWPPPGALPAAPCVRRAASHARRAVRGAVAVRLRGRPSHKWRVAGAGGRAGRCCVPGGSPAGGVGGRRPSRRGAWPPARPPPAARAAAPRGGVCAPTPLSRWPAVCVCCRQLQFCCKQFHYKMDI